MRHAEQVTFGGSGLDRAAELRGTTDLLADHGGQMVVLWNGKPLVAGEDRDLTLLRLPIDHPVLKDAVRAPILLGREEGVLTWAADISAWEPEEAAETLGSFVDPSEQKHPQAPEGRFAELRRIMTRLTARDAELAATAKAIHGWHDSHGFCARCGAASDIRQSGWQRQCPSCNAPHFPRTDPVVIMLITRGNRCLLGRSPGWPEGMYSCLAGFVEPGETIEAAVRREVFEESGVRVGPVRYLASQPWAFPSSLMIGCHGEAETSEIVLDPVELEDARWVSREDVADAAAGLRPDLMPARRGAIAHFMLRAWLADRLD
ncbi:NADH pyrophosphatase [Sagittula sp. P11]|uniref:NAD(+) diphosphatase n=1 Tax=Sagittula sp. P11 TaxID=2009329 RepID=UPI000C2D1023|nr:NAD(+) diphosphatase [Sagittula sp. P11]AUC52697.1 NADH pyrophosphatase [Sagittula sp. P11]